MGRVSSILPMFFCVCEYLETTSAEFFDTENYAPSRVNGLYSLEKQPNKPQALALLTLSQEFGKSNTENLLRLL